MMFINAAEEGFYLFLVDAVDRLGQDKLQADALAGSVNQMNVPMRPVTPSRR